MLCKCGKLFSHIYKAYNFHKDHVSTPFFKISDCLNQEKRLLNILQDMISVSCSIEHQKYLIGKILSFILSDQSATTSQQNNLTNKLEINFDWGKINIIS